MSSFTVALIKPDAAKSGNVGTIIAMAERVGLSVAHISCFTMSKECAEEFYEDHRGKDFFGPLVEFMTSDKIFFMALRSEGDDAVRKWRDLMGCTNSAHAAPGTIRNLFGSKDILSHNAVHGSDSDFNARREFLILHEFEIRTANQSVSIKDDSNEPTKA